jgi:hypothetical protein
MPWFNARLASGTEFFGGILILIGLGSRLVALPMAFTMVVAIITAKLGDVGGFVDLVGLEEWSYLIMFLVIALRGPGALSVDALLARLFSRAVGPVCTPYPSRSAQGRPGMPGTGTAAGPPRAWYERNDLEGEGVPGCVGCHSRAERAGGNDHVYVQVK